MLTAKGVPTPVAVKPGGVELTENELTLALPDVVAILTLTVLVVPMSAVVESKAGLSVTKAAKDPERIAKSDKNVNTASRREPGI
ncbi:MAG: hypothetical protein HYS53_03235 [Candidatus Aenigmarchaeota archaeon]|nr:hypothetical protein [Candidatus Aenigmarchaeota archaeon]